MKTTFCLFTLLFCISFCIAQDLIYLRDGRILKANVIEVHPHTVNFRLYAYPKGTVYTQPPHTIEKIVYGSGLLQTFTKVKYGKPAKRRKKNITRNIPYRHGIKVDLLAPWMNSFSLAYEKKLLPKMSIELHLGYIGIGRSVQNLEIYRFEKRDIFPDNSAHFTSHTIDLTREKGIFFRVGPKFKFTGKSPLIGFYAKPTFAYSHFNLNAQTTQLNENDNFPVENFNFSVSSSIKTNHAALLATFGYQHIFLDRFTIDAHAGIGYGVAWENISESIQGQSYLGYISPFENGYLTNEENRYLVEGSETFRYSHYEFYNLAFSLGLSTGILLK